MRADAKKSSMCDKKYSEAVDGCRSLQDRFYDEEMPRILAVWFMKITVVLSKKLIVRF